MADGRHVCSDTKSVIKKSEQDTSRSRCTDIPTVSVGTRGRTARDLVKGQEKLLTMLQDLKYELSKMDREADRLRKDVARSKQTFSVIFNTSEPLHKKAPQAMIPTVTPSGRKFNERDGDLGLQYLNKLCTFTPRRSLLSSYENERQSRNFDDIRDRIKRLSRSSSRSSVSYRTPGSKTPESYSTVDQYSGTESDIESTTSSHYCSHSSMGDYCTSFSGPSESISEDAGSSTESNITLRSSRSNVCNGGRRTSNFYKQFAEASQ